MEVALRHYEMVREGCVGFVMADEHPYRRPVVVAVGAVAALGLARKLWRRHCSMTKIRKQQKRCEDAVRRLTEHLNNGVSLKKRIQILAFTTTELHQKLQNGELTATEVLQTYQSKALEVHQDVNCLVEPIMEAEEMAKDLDSDVKRKKGLLHGIPVSLKENVSIKGYTSSAGMSYFLGQTSKEDCVIVKILKKQGAIPFMRTNVPQTTYSIDCSNPIYGATKNPYDKSRGPGGSSGGEGALIALGGSVIGIGSDIGGSIRIPSNMCGICGLKPTVRRLSTKDSFTFRGSQNIVLSTFGPMAKDVDMLVLLMRAFLVDDMFELDYNVVPIPFRMEIYESSKRLRIGYFTTCDLMTAVPACQRAVSMAKKAMQERGHMVVKIEPPDFGLAFKLFSKVVMGTSKDQLHKFLKDDLLNVVMTYKKRIHCIPKPLLWVISTLLSFVDKYAGEALWISEQKISISEWMILIDEVKDYQNKFFSMWKGHDLDVLLCPGYACPALPTDVGLQLGATLIYTAPFNLVNYAAGSVPVTRVTKVDEDMLKNYNPGSKPGNLFEKALKKMMVGTEGLPVNVQCIGLPFQEELVLRVMKEIEEAMKHQLPSTASL